MREEAAGCEQREWEESLPNMQTGEEERGYVQDRRLPFWHAHMPHTRPRAHLPRRCPAPSLTFPTPSPHLPLPLGSPATHLPHTFTCPLAHLPQCDRMMLLL